MIYITGDTHSDFGRFSYEDFPIGKSVIKKRVKENNGVKTDYMIITGDFGGIWYSENSRYYPFQQRNIAWLTEKPWMTLFIDGNHENFDLLDSLPEEDMFGSKVGVYKFKNEKIIHLKRGHVYTINDKTFFVFGGATSIDKASRVENVSWWEREIPSSSEFEYGLQTLDKYNWNVDYVISHHWPKKILMDYLKRDFIPLRCPVSDYLDIILNKLNFKTWYAGHMHINAQHQICPEKRFIGLYEKILELDNDIENNLNKINEHIPY